MFKRLMCLIFGHKPYDEVIMEWRRPFCGSNFTTTQDVIDTIKICKRCKVLFSERWFD